MKFSANGHCSLVINLFDLVDTEDVSASFNDLFQLATAAVSQPSLDDWEVIFQLVYNGGIPDIRVYHRQNSKSKEREKWVTIHIPIPTYSQVDWGVAAQTIVVLKTQSGSENWYKVISCNLLASLQEHCCMAALAGIIHALTTGLTVKGEKVQIEQNRLVA